MENVKKFYEALLADKTLQEKANQLNEQFKPQNGVTEIDEAAAIQAIIAFAKTQGYDFTPEEMNAFQNEMRPISDEQLDAATGGHYNVEACFCCIGGGGYDPTYDNSCGCVLYGSGAVDHFNRRLKCIGGGFIF